MFKSLKSSSRRSRLISQEDGSSTGCFLGYLGQNLVVGYLFRYLFKMLKVFGGGRSKVVPQQEILFKVFVMVCFFLVKDFL